MKKEEIYGRPNSQKANKGEVRVLKNPGEVGGQQLLPTASVIKKVVYRARNCSCKKISKTSSITIRIKISIEIRKTTSKKIIKDPEKLNKKCFTYQNALNLKNFFLNENIKIIYSIIVTIFNDNAINRNDIYQMEFKLIQFYKMELMLYKMKKILYTPMKRKIFTNEEEKRNEELKLITDKIFNGEIIIEMYKYVPIILNLKNCNIGNKFLQERLCSKLEIKKRL